MGINYVDSNDSEEKMNEVNNLIEGEDEEFYLSKEEPSLLEEIKLVVTCGVLVGCSSVTSKVV